MRNAQLARLERIYGAWRSGEAARRLALVIDPDGSRRWVPFVAP